MHEQPSNHEFRIHPCSMRSEIPCSTGRYDGHTVAQLRTGYSKPVWPPLFWRFGSAVGYTNRSLSAPPIRSVSSERESNNISFASGFPGRYAPHPGGRTILSRHHQCYRGAISCSSCLRSVIAIGYYPTLLSAPESFFFFVSHDARAGQTCSFASELWAFYPMRPKMTGSHWLDLRASDSEWARACFCDFSSAPVPRSPSRYRRRPSLVEVCIRPSLHTDPVG